MAAAVMDDADRLHILELIRTYSALMRSLGDAPWWLYPGRTAEAARAKHAAFVAKVLPLLPHIDWMRAVDDFERFLTLAPPPTDTNHCPTLTIDVVWHAVLADDPFYTRLCAKLGVARAPHCVEDRPAGEDAARFRVFLREFERAYNRAPYSPAFDEDAGVIADAAHALVERHLNRAIQEVREEVRLASARVERARAAAASAESAKWKAQHAKHVRQAAERTERFRQAAGIEWTPLRARVHATTGLTGSQLWLATERERKRLQRGPSPPITRQGSTC